MIKRLHPLAAPALLAFALAACSPGAAQYTKTEAPNQLTVANASTQFQLRFLPRSARLSGREAWRLAGMVRRGAIVPSDRVTIAASGAPWLVQQRVATVSRILLQYGIVVTASGPLSDVPRNAAIVEIGRYLVSTPPCPNWSGDPASDFTNALSSNYGCSTASDLAETVANPADLVRGQPLGAAPGRTAVAAVDRYLSDKVQLPASSGALPMGGAAAAAPGGSGGSGGSQ